MDVRENVHMIEWRHERLVKREGTGDAHAHVHANVITGAYMYSYMQLQASLDT